MERYTNWNLAASHLLRKSEIERKEACNTLTALKAGEDQKKQIAIRKTQQIEHEARILENWIKEKGQAASMLFQESGQRFVFGVDYGDGVGMVYFMGENGLQGSTELMGTPTEYTPLKKHPRTTSISAIGAVKAAVRFGGMEENQILEKLLEHLDRIAEHILKPD